MLAAEIRSSAIALAVAVAAYRRRTDTIPAAEDTAAAIITPQMTLNSHRKTAQAWLHSLSLALSILANTSTYIKPESDHDTLTLANALVPVFASEAYLRDSLVFSWDLRTVRGLDLITSHISSGLLHAPRSYEGHAKDKTSLSPAFAAGGITDLTLDDTAGLSPTILELDQPGMLELAFKFKTERGSGRGMARLTPSSSSESDPAGISGPSHLGWTASSAYFMLDTFTGQEEGTYKRKDARFGTWRETRRQQREEIEKDPYVLIGESATVHNTDASRSLITCAIRFLLLYLKHLFQ
jgi:hypothetical protein